MSVYKCNVICDSVVTLRNSVSLHISMYICIYMYTYVPHVPQYLGPLNRVADQPGCRSLHSAVTSHLVVPPVRLSTVTDQAFPVVSPQIWNDLPADVTSAQSLSTFCRRLKTSLSFLEITVKHSLNQRHGQLLGGRC